VSADKLFPTLTDTGCAALALRRFRVKREVDTVLTYPAVMFSFLWALQAEFLSASRSWPAASRGCRVVLAALKNREIVILTLSTASAGRRAQPPLSPSALGLRSIRIPTCTNASAIQRRSEKSSRSDRTPASDLSDRNGFPYRPSPIRVTVRVPVPSCFVHLTEWSGFRMLPNPRWRAEPCTLVSASEVLMSQPLVAAAMDPLPAEGAWLRRVGTRYRAPKPRK